MPSAPAEIHRVSPSLAVCQWFDPAVKADLFCTAIRSQGGVCLVDPFTSEPETLEALRGESPVAGIVVTNANHLRASAACAARLRVPILAHADAGVPDARPLSGLSDIFPEIETVEIPGAPAGEIALYSAAEGGTAIVGDALINFGSHGFTFLPAKYCLDAKRMRRSLRRLLDWNFARLLFAHGTPLLSDARQRLTALLEGEA